MANVTGVSLAITVLLFICLLGAEGRSKVEVITSANYSELFRGCWMVEFYAPWCPACKQFSSTWESFADWAVEADGGVRVSKVDVTVEKMLSGQFMVTHLPTVFHINEGNVREYRKPRQLSALITYIEDSEWQEEEPRSWWRNPTAFHMRGIGGIFWLSEKAQELQMILKEQYKLPTYVMYLMMALATILIGLSLGGVVVCCVEVCIRLSGGTRRQTVPPGTVQEKKRLQGLSEAPLGSEQREKEQQNPQGTLVEDQRELHTFVQGGAFPKVDIKKGEEGVAAESEENSVVRQRKRGEEVQKAEH